jgi:hypothetical protein
MGVLFLFSAVLVTCSIRSIRVDAESLNPDAKCSDCGEEELLFPFDDFEQQPSEQVPQMYAIRFHRDDYITRSDLPSFRMREATSSELIKQGLRASWLKHSIKLIVDDIYHIIDLFVGPEFDISLALSQNVCPGIYSLIDIHGLCQEAATVLRCIRSTLKSTSAPNQLALFRAIATLQTALDEL